MTRREDQKPERGGPVHFAPTAWQILAALKPQETPMPGLHERAERTVDFKPTPHPGWAAHFVSAAGKHWTTPIAGWLIRDEHVLDNDDDFRVPAPGYVPYRFAVAAICVEGVIAPVTDSPDFWYVADPSDSEPTAAEIAGQRDLRAKEVAAQRARIAYRTPA